MFLREYSTDFIQGEPTEREGGEAITGRIHGEDMGGCVEADVDAGDASDFGSTAGTGTNGGRSSEMRMVMLI